MKILIRHKWIEATILCLFIFLFRLYATIPIEDSGDSFVKWYETKRLFYGLPFSRLDHHTMRWGINFLSLFFQKIFGTQPSIYYLAPAFTAAGAAFFIYQIGLLLHGRLLALSAMLLFSFHPVIINAGSQLFPGIFSIFYVLGSIFFLLIYENNRQKKYLICSAVFLFLAYGAKITNLFFLPAILLYILFILHEKKAIFIYFGILFLGFCIETAWIDSILGDYSLPGRLALAGGHLNFMQSGSAKVAFLSAIFKRWEILPNYMYLHSIIGFVAAFYFLNHRTKFPKETLIALCYLSVSFLITFAISSLDPIQFLLPNRPRYLNVTIPLSLLLTLRLATLLGQYKYIVVTTLLLAAPYPIKLVHLIQSPTHRQFYKINSHKQQIMNLLNKGYCLAFLREKHARLYRAAFIDDNYALGIDAKKTVHIYKVPPHGSQYNESFTMYILKLSDNNTIKGIASPYPNNYVLSVRTFVTPNLNIDPSWEQIW